VQVTDSFGGKRKVSVFTGYHKYFQTIQEAQSPKIFMYAHQLQYSATIYWAERQNTFIRVTMAMIIT